MALTSLSPSVRQASVTVQAVLAFCLSALIGMRIDITYGLTAGGVMAILLTPVIISTVFWDKWVRWIVAMSGIAVLSGGALTMWHSSGHSWVPAVFLSRTVMVVQLALLIAALIWSHRTIGVAATTAAFGLGATLGIPFNLSDDPNLWRFTLSIPIGILVLALVSLQGRLWVQLAGLFALAAVGLANDSRSNSAFLLLAAVVLVWQRVAQANSRKRKGIGGLLSLLAAGILLFFLLQSAIVEGYFGEATQQRTEMQIEQSGSLLLGGRPEIAASVALIERYPLGIGSGSLANYGDIVHAKSGMLGIGYDPNNGYVEKFMFGGGIEVHSVVGDLWIWFGIPGLLFALVTVIALVRGVQRGFANATLTALFAYLVTRFVWDFAFSPVASTMRLWPLVASLAIAYASYGIIENRRGLRSLEPGQQDAT